MKRKLITLGLLTASILPIATPAFAIIETIQEKNDFYRSKVLHQTGDSFRLDGSLSLNDTEDRFFFTVPERGRHSFRYLPKPAIKDAKLTVFRRQPGAQNVKVLSLNPQEQRSIILQQGQHFLLLEGRTNSSPEGYLADIKPPTVTSRKINVDLISAEGRDKFDPGIGKFVRPDFFVETSMNNVSKPNTKVHGNNNTPRFNHRVSHTLPRSENRVFIKIRLKDDDSGSKADLADINPSTKDKEITLRYIPTTGMIFNTSDNKLLGRSGVPFSLAGTNGPKATLNLMIGHVNQ